MVRESTVIFIQVGEKSGKANYLVHVSFSCTVVCKVVVPFAVSECKLCHFA